MKLKRIFCGLLAGTLALTMLAGCGKKKDDSNKEVELDVGAGKNAVKMEMWTFVDLHGQFYEDMLKTWNKEHEEKEQINLKMQVMPYEDMHNKLTIVLQSGKGIPDMCDVEIGRFPGYLKGDVQFMDLSSYVDPYRENIVASRMEVYSKDGKNYGVPTHVGANVAFYNTDILEAAGVDYTTIKTWDDYKAAGEKVKATGKAMGAAETNNTAVYDTMMVAQGADKTDEKGNPTLDTPESIKALTLIQELAQSGIDKTIPGGHPDTEEARGPLKDDYACIIRPLWFMSRYTNYMDSLEGKIAIAPAPVFEEGQTRSFGGGGTGTVVSKTAENPELAAEWLCWAKLSELGNEQIWNVLGFDPCNMELWSNEELTHNKDNQFVKFFQTNPFDVLNEIKDEIGTVKSNEAVPTVNDVMTTVTLNDVIENGVAPAEAAKAAQEQAINEMKS